MTRSDLVELSIVNIIDNVISCPEIKANSRYKHKKEKKSLPMVVIFPVRHPPSPKLSKRILLQSQMSLKGAGPLLVILDPLLEQRDLQLHGRERIRKGLCNKLELCDTPLVLIDQVAGMGADIHEMPKRLTS